MKKILVLQPDPRVTLGRYHFVTDEFDCQVMQLFDYNTLQKTLSKIRSPKTDFQGLIILGGRMNALDHNANSWLIPVKELIRRTVAENIPVLGICLGHQILAHAFGGAVELESQLPGFSGEEGVAEIFLTEAGATDPFTNRLASLTKILAFESHHDVVTNLPKNATLLASSDACKVQIMRYGSAIGIQFHPEATAEILYTWELNSLNGSLSSAKKLRTECQKVEQEAFQLSDAIWQAFAELL